MRGWKQRKEGGLFPLPFRSLTFSLSSYFKSVQSLTLGVPYFTTNQQHGIPCFINEVPPDWPVWTRVCVVKGPAQGAMAKTKKGEKKRSAPPEDQHPRRPFYEPVHGLMLQIEAKKKAAALRALEEKTVPSRPLNEEPPSRPLNEESPSRPLNEEPPSRSLTEDETRLSSSSEEAVLDTTLTAQSEKSAQTGAPSSFPSGDAEQRAIVLLTSDEPVEKEKSSVQPLNQEEKGCVEPSLDDERDPGHVEVNYNGDM